ncbi:N-acetylmuramoyl-L-alanine amidase [Agathobaculum sp.]|uniref:N-acetylmuramoyl-L-alanine amidase n=1 Tax=Agathobaculum sp. TaxID=2048138 RepID=UPI003AB3DA1A
MSIRCDIYDPKLYQIWFAAAPYSAAGKPAKTLRQWAADESADIVYNLALFNMTGQGSDRYGVIKGRTLQYLKAKGRDCGYGGTPERLVLDASNAVSGWKLAVKDGKVNGSLGKSDRRSRNMCGVLTDGRYIHVQTSASHTEHEVAQYVRDHYDVKLLLVQDAGGSTGMYRVGDNYLFAPEKKGADGRPVCSVVCIKAKGKTKKEDKKSMSKKVFIGVGHGGSDSGAVGYIVEKEANLAMALACRDYLTAHGVEVRMSRTKDEEDPINEEVRECNAYAPDLAIDVHNNSGGGDGFEVFHTLNGGVGKTLAQNIEKQVKAIGQNSRGCKTRRGQRGDYYAFVRDTKCPAVICEGVFVDTKADAARADTKAKQQAFGVAYAKGILDTLGIKYDTAASTKPAEPETDAETQAAITKVQQAAGLSDKTMQYLLDYEYGVELVKKLAAMQK